VAGVLVGPYTPGFVADIHTVSTIAEWGVVFLLFAVGVEFSFRSLLDMRAIAIFGGLPQIFLTGVLGWGLGRMLGFRLSESLLLGAVLAMSSTMVVLKMLDERGESDSYHGKSMLAILVTQDLVVVIIAAIVPLLADLTPDKLPQLLLRALLGAVYLALAVLLAVKVLP
jgi:monovalent cation:H+ antiporter-2, CPA2 family